MKNANKLKKQGLYNPQYVQPNEHHQVEHNTSTESESESDEDFSKDTPPTEPRNPLETFPHIDDFIDGSWQHRTDEERYARFVFNYFRMPAVLKNDFQPWMKQFKLFCTWSNTRFRVTGASRLGDVWLASDFNRETGYDHRVAVNECTNWSAEP